MPQPVPWIIEHFGRFDWHDDPDHRGSIVIAGDWQLHNLARIEPPFALIDGLGRPIKLIACHHLIADQLTAALVYLRDQRLYHLINTWDGCWCARHIQSNPAKALSSHSWGIAIDLNARQFPFGVRRFQDGRLRAAFERFGFEWGGNWRTPDPMHFEAVEIQSQPLHSIQVIINDRPLIELPFDPRLEAGHIIAPLRPIVEALGATITYHPEQRKVYIYTSGGLPKANAAPAPEA